LKRITADSKTVNVPCYCPTPDFSLVFDRPKQSSNKNNDNRFVRLLRCARNDKEKHFYIEIIPKPKKTLFMALKTPIMEVLG
jgi:hypothetical protein